MSSSESPKRGMEIMRKEKDSPPRSTSSMASRIHNPSDWNHLQWLEKYASVASGDDSPLVMRSRLQNLSFHDHQDDDDGQRDANGLNRTLWRNDSNLTHESRNDTHQAVQEAKLQVSFAEQTAREMNEVLQWWKTDDLNLSQSRSLKDNSLVYASAHSSDEQDGDCIGKNESSLVLSPTQDPNWTPLRLSPCNTLRDSFHLQAFLSPIAPVDSPQRLAEEQSFAVDEVCSDVKRMRKVLADLDSKSPVVLDAYDSSEPTTLLAEPRQCCLRDLSWLDRLYVLAKCTGRRYSLRLQQWLYHALPPLLISYWLALSSKPPSHQDRILISWMLLLLLLLSLIILYTACSAWNDNIRAFHTVTATAAGLEHDDVSCTDDDFTIHHVLL